MEGFEWAQSNLKVRNQKQLQAEGVSVYAAPLIAPDRKVVNLANGGIELFTSGEECPEEGYFADHEDLERYCRRRGIPLEEVNGLMQAIQ